MRTVSHLILFMIWFGFSNAASARPFACAELDAGTSINTAIKEICISEALVVLKSRSRIADDFFYRPILLGSLLSAREYEFVPIDFRGSPKGATMRVVIQPARGNLNHHLTLYALGSRVTMIGSPVAAPKAQHLIHGFVQKDLLLY